MINMTFDTTFVIINSLASALTMMGVAWGGVFLFGRSVILREEEQKTPAVPLRWWTGALAICLAIGYGLSIAARTYLIHNTEAAVYHFIYLAMLALPVCAIIMVQLVSSKRISWARILSNFVPFFVMGLIGTILQTDWFFQVMLVLMSGYMIAMIVYMVIRGKKHEKWLRNTYSMLAGRSVKWMLIVPLLLLMIIASYIYFVYWRNSTILLFHYSLALILWNFTFLKIYQMVIMMETTHSKQLTEDDEDTDEQEGSAKARTAEKMNSEEIAQFLKRLHEVCEVKEAFTNPDLTRDELAHQMAMGHTALTRSLKQATGLSFYDYINKIRIQKATKMIAEDKMDMWSIGQSVGYKYRSTFYNAFKAVHHCTPSEYSERIRTQRKL